MLFDVTLDHKMDDQEEEEEFVVVFEFNADLEVAQALHLLANNSNRPQRFINRFQFTDDVCGLCRNLLEAFDDVA